MPFVFNFSTDTSVTISRTTCNFISNYHSEKTVIASNHILSSKNTYTMFEKKKCKRIACLKYSSSDYFFKKSQRLLKASVKSLLHQVHGKNNVPETHWPVLLPHPFPLFRKQVVPPNPHYWLSHLTSQSNVQEVNL